MKYNTVRSIINPFKTNNRVNIKKKNGGYTYRKYNSASGRKCHSSIIDE